MSEFGRAPEECDFLIIGAGIAGMAAAEQLSRDGRVIIFEQEENAGFHATSRSAAIFVDSYADTEIQTLSRISRPIFETPPFSVEHPLLVPRGLLHVRLTGAPRLPTGDKRANFPKLNADDICDLVPALKRDQIDEGYYEASAADIDVHGLQSALLRETRARGGQLLTGRRVESARRVKGKWQVVAGGVAVSASVVVNAAGAWAGKVADIFGACDPGLQPMRRTAVVVDAPTGLSVTKWPMVVDLQETRFFKPEGGKIMASPADETSCPPHDAFAEEIDIATAVHRLEEIADFNITHVPHNWAGLRSFMPDRIPSIGFDPDVEGFFWLAGQGGSGIQTAPAQGLLTRSLVTQCDHLPAGFDLGQIRRYFSPSRFQHREAGIAGVAAEL